MDQAMIDLVTIDLENEFGELVDHGTLRAVVEARAKHFDDAPIQDFVPMFVERAVRRSLTRIS